MHRFRWCVFTIEIPFVRIDFSITTIFDHIRETRRPCLRRRRICVWREVAANGTVARRGIRQTGERRAVHANGIWPGRLFFFSGRMSATDGWSRGWSRTTISRRRGDRLYTRLLHDSLPSTYLIVCIPICGGGDLCVCVCV